jgi:hypothetical protein
MMRKLSQCWSSLFKRNRRGESRDATRYAQGNEFDTSANNTPEISTSGMGNAPIAPDPSPSAATQANYLTTEANDPPELKSAQDDDPPPREPSDEKKLPRRSAW